MNNKSEMNLPRLAVITREKGDSRYYRDRYGDNILGVTAPESIEQLQELVKEAARANFSLHIHGQQPVGNQRYDNVVIVDLKNLNKVLEVNTRSAYALIEPGVTFQQLHKYLEDNNTGLWIDCGRNQLNTLSSSIANHEFGYTPYGDHMMMQCGMEVMLADGELVRTTMGALPGNNIWQLFKWGYGPWVDAIFTQSSLGIITKIGLWLMPAPPAYKPFMLSLPHKEDIGAAVNVLRDLKINVIVPNSVVISNALLDALPFIKAEDYAGVNIDQLKSDMDLGEWNVYGALYNTPDNVDLLWPMVSDALTSIDGARLFTDGEREGDQVWKAREGLMRGIPFANYDEFESSQKPYRADIGLACPPDAEEIQKLNEIVSSVLSKYNIEDLSECVLGWRSIVKRNYILFGIENQQRAEQCINEIIASAATSGFGLTHFDCNQPELVITRPVDQGYLAIQTHLKTALDPKHILV